MELYTEEQVLRMLEVCRDTDLYEHILTFEDILKTETPIELPSDEEIESKSSNEYQEQKQSYENSVEMFPIDFGNYLEVGFIEGAKWMRDKIGGNK